MYILPWKNMYMWFFFFFFLIRLFFFIFVFVTYNLQVQMGILLDLFLPKKSLLHPLFTDNQPIPPKYVPFLTFPLEKQPSHTSHIILFRSIPAPFTLPPFLLFIALYFWGLVSFLSLSFSLDLSELAKAAKKKLQAVSFIVHLHSNSACSCECYPCLPELNFFYTMGGTNFLCVLDEWRERAELSRSAKACNANPRTKS